MTLFCLPQLGTYTVIMHCMDFVSASAEVHFSRTLSSSMGPSVHVRLLLFFGFLPSFLLTKINVTIGVSI